MKELITIEGNLVVQDDDGRGRYVAAGRIDADGAYSAYHPITAASMICATRADQEIGMAS
jgi:hypothetical protein